MSGGGVWLDRHLDNRMQAAQFVSRHYYNQDPRLLEFVLSQPPDRVKYTNLTVRRPDFEEIEQLGREAGILGGLAGFQEYADPSFVKDSATIEAYPFEDAAFTREIELTADGPREFLDQLAQAVQGGVRQMAFGELCEIR